MEARRLSELFAPDAIAIVGASERANAPGGRVLRYLTSHGFEGPIFPLNRTGGSVGGVPAFTALEALPQVPDLVIAAIPIEGVGAVVGEAGRLGVRGCVVFAAGAGGDDARRLAAVAESNGVALLGPNCTGFVNVPDRVAATFSSALEIERLRPGGISVVTQSGGVGSALFNRLHDQGLGMNLVVSTGDELQLGIGHILRQLADDPRTECAIVYVESFRHPELFLDGAERLRAAGRPLIVLKAGSSEVAQRAAQTHTNALAGDHMAARAVLDEVGAIPVDSVGAAIDAATMLTAAAASGRRLPDPPRVAIVGTSGGGCVLAADAAARAGLEIADLAPATREVLASLLPSFAVVANPLDVTAGLLNDPAAFAAVVEAIAADEGVDAGVIVGLITSRAIADTITAALERVRAAGGPPLAVAIETGSLVEEVYAELRDRGLATVRGLDACMAAIGAAASGGRASTPVLAGAEPPRVRPWPDSRSGDLGELESLELLAEAGLPVATALAIGHERDLEDPRLTYPLALKVSGASVFHKQRSGLLALDLMDPAAAREALARLRAAAGASLGTGWVVVAQPMVPRGLELLLSMKRDPIFGGMVVLGLGGGTVEAVRRIELARASVAHRDPAGLVQRLDVTRGLSPQARSGLIEVVARFAGCVLATGPRLRECEVNPLIVLPDGGLTIVDAKICLD